MLNRVGLNKYQKFVPHVSVSDSLTVVVDQGYSRVSSKIVKDPFFFSVFLPLRVHCRPWDGRSRPPFLNERWTVRDLCQSSRGFPKPGTDFSLNTDLVRTIRGLPPAASLIYVKDPRDKGVEI